MADGFEVQLFASEPLVRQPVTMTFDERGRLWVIQYLQYPTPAGLKPVEVDRYLRTKYDRVPEPPPHGPRAPTRSPSWKTPTATAAPTRAKDFVTGLNLASALAIGNGGVYVGQAPYLLFYPDRDHDDVPDGDPEVLLTGFGLEDAHAVVNSLQWGPDGWLYGAQGSTVTADIRGVGFQQGIWRYHPPTKRFELFAEGGGNTWGLDFDATARPSPAPTGATPSACTRCKGATTSKASPSTARCTIRTPTATSSTPYTPATSAGTSPAAASSTRPAPFRPSSAASTSPPTCSPTPSTGTRSRRPVPR